ncbi:MAG TPA: SWIM zinc finger family protein [Steroidobacteraceae bacterium]|nr:SWIM zinc finger family protein [Steroidobacteraceae bacterium]
MTGEPMPWWNYERKPSVLERRRRAARDGNRLAKSAGKRGRALSPAAVNGRKIASSFWGKAWCDNLESYRDYEHRLPRGRSYLRNGAVLDLNVEAGKITATVSGTSLYEVVVAIKPVASAHWSGLKAQCAGQVGSVIELLEGRLSDRVMQIITHREQGLFPKPAEIEMSCSCPDWAAMCKHVAAVMYGIGARLDSQPELLFTLRKVDHGELIAAATDLDVTGRGAGRKTLADEDLGSVFGIDLAEAPPRKAAAEKRPRKRASKSGKSKVRKANKT